MIGVNSSAWEGLDGMGDELFDELRRPAEALVKEAAVLFEGALKLTLTGARGGRTYRVTKRGRGGMLHVSAAPGEPPAVMFGGLRLSIGHLEPRWDVDTVFSEIGPGLGQPPAGGDVDPARTYARILEWGGVITHPSGAVIRILPRPYLEPTAARMDPVIADLFGNEI